MSEFLRDQDVQHVIYDTSFNSTSTACTSRLPSCAVQELKIRRPNYSDFSVKTMVIMKLFQQQNGNTCFIIVLKVSFMWKYANYSRKEMK